MPAGSEIVITVATWDIMPITCHMHMPHMPPGFVQAKAYTATVPETDARRARMVPPGLGPCSHVVWWRRRLRGRCRAGSWLRARLRDRLSALSESARADGQQSSHKKNSSNQGAHGVLSARDTSRFSTM